jgi:hypothetical protein
MDEILLNCCFKAVAHSQSSVNWLCAMQFWLSAMQHIREYIREFETEFEIFEGITQGPRYNWFMKKTGGRKSRDTVSLKKSLLIILRGVFEFLKLICLRSSCKYCTVYTKQTIYFISFFRFVSKQICLFRLFRYWSETPKRTETNRKNNWLVSRNKPKNNRNRLSFGLFRFEPKIYFVCFEDTLPLLLVLRLASWPNSVQNSAIV